jgi:hypothetical protein
VIDKLEKKNPNKDVAARMIREEWGTTADMSKRTVSRYCSRIGRPWRAVLKKLPLTDEMKQAAKQWGKALRSKPERFWVGDVLAVDCKAWPWYTCILNINYQY